ncbi:MULTISPECIES: CBS domain-containing protein [Prauserella salsuginis group]|uniref:CBS domain-containing protein n=2 Tax=Prauserella salsuginis group TaxID=2893672 RepID=A0A839XIE5_9PSEU|nr:MULTISPECIES: CBS domain-containing protein [Prauserella salsuginis group]MBB3662277.1 CBS domain-containing protein [Prauserella sediminis]MCR3719990.1 CBS domain-containing protein [Prauserella flava]MCR3736466.1 CBS domain-containing protein [Prauserella salsuginis]
MPTAREIMTSGVECVDTDQTAADAARLMARHRVGAVPICGPDNKLKGVVTDRDIAVKVVGQGRDAGTFPAGNLNQAEAVTIGADDSADEVLATMTRHQVRRLPVIDNDRLVGMISIADVARALPQDATGELVAALSAE